MLGRLSECKANKHHQGTRAWRGVSHREQAKKVTGPYPEHTQSRVHSAEQAWCRSLAQRRGAKHVPGHAEPKLLEKMFEG